MFEPYRFQFDSEQHKTVINGLSPKAVDFWFTATQGSRIMPLAWFRNLRHKESGRLFASNENLKRYGFVGIDRLSLPIGFAIDRQSNLNLNHTKSPVSRTPWIGLTCSACHTGKISYKGTSLLLLGAPGQIDLQRFLADMNASLVYTFNNQAQWEAFEKTVLAETGSLYRKSNLKSEVLDFIAKRRSLQKQNETRYPYGFGRVDAFGRLLNRLSFILEGEDFKGSEPDAPVNFPHLWNAHKQEYVQWNASARNRNTRLSEKTKPNLDLGALGRNVGQVLGVFGDMKFEAKSNFHNLLDTVKSSVNIDNLKRLERISNRLPSPRWPAIFPKIRTELADRGRQHYKAHCIRCHLLPQDVKKRQPAETIVQYNQLPQRHKTDITMACNALKARLNSGVWQGRKEGAIGGEIIDKSIPGLTALDKAAKGVIAKNLSSIVSAIPQYLKDPRESDVKSIRSIFNEGEDCKTSQHPLLAYKARPLDGIWATPPYLHNGSVPTLLDLLKLSKHRPAFYWQGSREYDPFKLGFSTLPSKTNNQKYRVKDRFGTAITGNGNQGHEYGARELDHREKLELIEFIKML